MKHIELLLLSALLLTALGCSKKEMGEPYADTRLANITTSDCLMNTDALAAKDMNTDSIAVTIASGILSVTHYNMMLDCGSGEHIVTTIERVDNTITVTENVGEQGRTNCVCLYDNSFQIAYLPPRPFTLVVKVKAGSEQKIVYQQIFE